MTFKRDSELVHCSVHLDCYIRKVLMELQASAVWILRHRGMGIVSFYKSSTGKWIRIVDGRMAYQVHR